MTYTGRWRDEETGLYHHRARSYDPGRGRCPHRDPLGVLPCANVYLHGDCRPVSLRDALGLWSAKELKEMAHVVEDSVTKTGSAADGFAVLAALLMFAHMSNEAWNSPGSLEGAGYDPDARDGVGDACKHCIWQCRLARHFGAAVAQRLGTIHERHGKDEAERNAQAQASRGDSEGAERIRDNAADAEGMDQWNNAHGRDCEERGIDCETCCLEVARRGALLNRQTVTFVEGPPALSRVGPFPCDVRRRKPVIVFDPWRWPRLWIR